MVISMIPIIGWIFMLFIGFYLGCVAGFLFGSVYGRAINLMPGGGDPRAQTVGNSIRNSSNFGKSLLHQLR